MIFVEFYSFMILPKACSQAKANSQNIYAIVTVKDVRIRNLEFSPGKFERKILILALRIMTLHSCLDIFSEQNHNTAPTEAIS